MRLVNGALSAALALGVLASGMAVVNFTARSWAARRVAEQGDHLNAEAVLLVF